MKLIGKWAFVIGVLLAVILGFLGKVDQTVAIVLVLLGLIVGLLNITSKEATPFLLAGVSLLIATYWGKQVMIVIPALANILEAIMILVVPAVILVALREVFVMAKKR